jgi:hypothetical protein
MPVTPTEKTSNSTTPGSLSVDEQLADITDPGIYQLRISRANLANGETLIVRCKVKVRTGDSLETLWERTFVNAIGAEGLTDLPVVVSPHEIKFSIEQQGGTLRAYRWAVYTW